MKVMRKIFFLTVIFSAVLFFLILFFAKKEKGSGKVICFEKHCFSVEVALKNEERQRGLMFREFLGEKEGMLFIFEKEGIYPFWMKNTLLPLDIIWINESKEVVFISKNNQPCIENNCNLITPGKKAKYVLELNAGTADKINLKAGDKLIFNANGY